MIGTAMNDSSRWSPRDRSVGGGARFGSWLTRGTTTALAESMTRSVTPLPSPRLRPALTRQPDAARRLDVNVSCCPRSTSMTAPPATWCRRSRMSSTECSAALRFRTPESAWLISSSVASRRVSFVWSLLD